MVSAAGVALTERHRQAQLAVRALMLREFLRLWPLWRGDDETFRDLVAATIPLVAARYQVSAALASSFYQAFRFAENVPGAATPRVASGFDPDAVTASMYVTGRVQTAAALRSGLSAERAMESALVRVAGAVTRHALAGGRETLLESVAADREAVGWQRVTSASPCAFCLLLASRGPVFKEDTVGFRAHDHCSCSSQPVYEPGAAGWSDQALAHRAAYERAVREAREAGELERGTTNDRLNALRRLLAAQGS